MFSGSYAPEDVQFLLKPVRLEPTPLEEKERLIQSGRMHYSEMIGVEMLPSPVYLRLFHQSLLRQKARFARHVVQLAGLIAAARTGPVTLISLARAGTPIGVLLARILRGQFERPVTHYSISIIRDRGVDETALRFILARHPSRSVVFVDGWTGKGVIARELRRAVTNFNAREGSELPVELFVVADLGGVAVAATAEDYLIPSSVLGCTISGLVSRSILNDSVLLHGDFHGCIHYQEWQSQDLSRWFVDTMMNTIESLTREEIRVKAVTDTERAELRQRNEAFLHHISARYSVRHMNHIKPGIGEATRVLLRRLPDRLLLRELAHEDIEHLRVLADEKRVPIEIDPSMPYLATALIQEVGP
jgi:hypothetical protein